MFLDEVTFKNLATRLVTQYFLNEEGKFEIAYHQILDTYMPLRAEWQSELLDVKKAWPTALDLAFGKFGKQGQLSLRTILIYVRTYILIAVKNS